MKQFQTKLGEAVNGKVGGPLSNLSSSFGGLGGVGSDLKKRLEEGTGLLAKAQTGGGSPLKGLKLPSGIRLP